MRENTKKGRHESNNVTTGNTAIISRSANEFNINQRLRQSTLAVLYVLYDLFFTLLSLESFRTAALTFRDHSSNQQSHHRQITRRPTFHWLVA